MRYDRNFNPEWGYVAPAPSVMRTARVVGLAAIIGATVGAATVLSLLDRPTMEASVAARTLVTPDPKRPASNEHVGRGEQPTEPQQVKSPAEAQNSAEQKAQPGAAVHPQPSELVTTTTPQRPTSAAALAEAPAVKDTLLCSDVQRYSSGRGRSRAGPEAAKQETAHVGANRAAYGCSAL